VENEAKFYLGIQLNMISCQASPVADLEKNKKMFVFSQVYLLIGLDDPSL